MLNTLVVDDGSVVWCGDKHRRLENSYRRPSLGWFVVGGLAYDLCLLTAFLQLFGYFIFIFPYFISEVMTDEFGRMPSTCHLSRGGEK